MASYVLTLNKADLVFFPSISKIASCGHVAQVIVKTKRAPNVGELAAFFLAQHEISEAVESLIMAHILSPLPTAIVLEGDGYILSGSECSSRICSFTFMSEPPWAITMCGTGTTEIREKWGTQAIVPCEHKWVFLLEVLP